MSEPPIAEAFDLIARLAMQLGAAPLFTHEGCWVHVLDERWTIAVNGHRTPQRHEGVEVPPYHCYVEYNGLPAGCFHPYGGLIAAGREANEAAFLQALRRALARAGGAA